MKSLFYKLAPLFQYIPPGLLANLTGRKLICPFYHLISDYQVIHIKHIYKIRSISEFERDLDFLFKHFRPIEVCELINAINNKVEINDRTMLLSFDDGLREFHDVVAPILIKKGVPAICFLNPTFVNNKDLFYRYKLSVIIEKLKNNSLSENLKKEIELWFKKNDLKFDSNYKSLYHIKFKDKHYFDELALLLGVDFIQYLDENKPYMTSDQIKKLKKQGFAFGAHSIDHPRYSELSKDQQVIQTETSIKDVMSNFGGEYKLFSFPFTDFGISGEFFDTIFNLENPIADLTFGSAGLKLDSYRKNIQRIPVEVKDYTARQIIYGEYLYYILKAIVNKNVIKRS